jgi:DNA modification methylase
MPRVGEIRTRIAEKVKFYVGLHIYNYSHLFEKAFVSVNRFRDLKSLAGFNPNEWILDSGAFTEVTKFGGFRHDVAEYAYQIRRVAKKGKLVAAVAQDYMCEEFALKKTGAPLEDHQRWTIERYDSLMLQDVAGVYIMPVLQGRASADYVRHLQDYGDRIGPGAYVGVGSVCKRNGKPEEVVEILEAIHNRRPDLKLHGFGLKLTALAHSRVRGLLYSADSMAWSQDARLSGRDANSWREAAQYRDRVEALLNGQPNLKRPTELGAKPESHLGSGGQRLSQLSPYWSDDHRGVELYLGDCETFVPLLPDYNKRPDLIFADPPFNIGYTYDLYQDNKTPAEYLAWCRRWLKVMYESLSVKGTFWLAVGARIQAHLRVLAEEVGFLWRDTVIWHYTFGPRQKHKLTPSWVALHYFTKGNEFTWHGDDIKVPSARQIKYNDKRAEKGGKLPDNVWILLPKDHEGAGCFDPQDNAILESRVCGTFKERTEHPCQMNVLILERLIRLTSNPGDLILDPFLGSGTTAEAALTLNRCCVGIELSEAYLRDIVIPRLTS